MDLFDHKTNPFRGNAPIYHNAFRYSTVFALKKIGTVAKNGLNTRFDIKILSNNTHEITISQIYFKNVTGA